MLPLGCSSTQKHPKAWAIMMMIRVLAANTFPSQTLGYSSWPRGLDADLRLVPEFLGKGMTFGVGVRVRLIGLGWTIDIYWILTYQVKPTSERHLS